MIPGVFTIPTPRAGFTHRGDVELSHRIAARYEKRAEEGGAST